MIYDIFILLKINSLSQHFQKIWDTLRAQAMFSLSLPEKSDNNLFGLPQSAYCGIRLGRSLICTKQSSIYYDYI